MVELRCSLDLALACQSPNRSDGVGNPSPIVSLEIRLVCVVLRDVTSLGRRAGGTRHLARTIPPPMTPLR
jgi:hypothetical protein